ncbi:nuclear transport factor 2 family protein [Actinoallomurus sp. NBC_01490]|uniref:YybH family protein n=1 Tax=Actinoallomurus sp. NBC_01490 TaxID=2903557 RepID=UPI002E359687|nr:nuclear transport factor 2 family protein [Actinoallomurus sp. NBC_01490]
MYEVVDYDFGPAARNRLAGTTLRGREGAVAALETFYYALNSADLDTLAEVWSDDELAQLDNPVGGIIRSGAAITELYRRIFSSGMDLSVTFTDAATYVTADTAVFAGRERCEYTDAEGTRVPVEFRTSRFFAWVPGEERWRQIHHHGSADDPGALRAYQAAVRR